MTKNSKKFFLLSFSLTLGLGLIFLAFGLPQVQATNVNVSANVPTSSNCGDGNIDAGEVCDDNNTTNCDGCKGDCTRLDNICGDGIVECGEVCESDDDCPEDTSCNLCICGIPCFLAGTQISLADNSSLPIEQVRPGDMVLSYNEPTGNLEPALVLKTFKHQSRQHLVINKELKVTANHPLFVNGQWLDAGEIKIGDELLRQDGQTVVVLSVEKEAGDFLVYNLEVDKNHNYFAEGYLAHNKGECVPDCSGQECGPSNCPGISCGSCAANEECIGGQCVLQPYCGDGIQDPGEECDDGNTASNDCCSSSCVIQLWLPPPTVSAITESSAIINWSTSSWENNSCQLVVSSSILDWGRVPPPSEGSISLSDDVYSQPLTGLDQATTYHFLITAAYNGLVATRNGSFTTLGPAEDCYDGIDNDGDGDVDFLDTDCYCEGEYECTDWAPEPCPEEGIQTRECTLTSGDVCWNLEPVPDVIKSCTPECEISCGPCQEINLEQCICEDITPCCGNLVCEVGETHETCPNDCIEICIPNWVPTDWSECVNGVQTRGYTDINNCLHALQPPPDERCCLEGCEVACGLCQQLDLGSQTCIPVSPCCGNRICEIDQGENVLTCPVDCGIPPGLIIDLPQCLDGLDNDLDGFVDYPADPGCSQPSDNSELSFFELLEKLAQLLNNPYVEQINKIAAPLLIATMVINTFATFSLLNFLSYLQFLFTQPLAALFRRKRRKWGIVYNSLSKQAVDLAIVRFYQKENQQIVQSRVTDKLGRYHFLADPGRYYITVTKPKFNFPTEYLKDVEEDVKYLDVYHGETIEVTADRADVALNIPIDPVEEVKPVAKVIFRHYLRKVQYAAAFSAIPLATISMAINPGALTFILFSFHCLLFVLFKRLGYQRPPKNWGVVYDKKDRKPLSRAVTRIYDKQYNKLLETRVTDAKGRYSFLVNNNIYYVTAEKLGYRPHKSDEIDLVSKDQEAIVGLDIGLEKGKVKTVPLTTPSAPPVQPIAQVTPLPDVSDRGQPAELPLAEKVEDLEVGKESLQDLLKSKEEIEEIKQDIDQKQAELEKLEDKVETVEETVEEKLEKLDQDVGQTEVKPRPDKPETKVEPEEKSKEEPPEEKSIFG